MTAIAIFNGLFCEADSVVKSVVEITGFDLITDKEIITNAARMSGLDEGVFDGMLLQTASGRAFGAREQLTAWMRLAVAQLLTEERDAVIFGYAALLAPEANEILRVCLISDTNDRLREAKRVHGYSESAALELIHSDDMLRADWAISLAEGHDPWASPRYDMVIPVGSLGVSQSAYLIVKQLAKPALGATDFSRGILKDHLLASEAHALLAHKDCGLAVSSEGGNLMVRLKDHDRALRAEARELADSITEMTGVKSVEVGTGRSYSQGDVYSKGDPCGLHRGARATRTETSRGYVGAECSAELARDCELAARIRAGLALQEYPGAVHVKDGVVSLTITDHKAMLTALARRLCALLTSMDGVRGVEVGVDTAYHQAAQYRRVRRNMAASLLSAPDRKFELALSRRLQAAVGALVVYDESALSRVKDIEVLILDVNMPGIDGLGVLQQLKYDHPHIPVLILASRESAVDRETCLGLGARAYLNKPVNAEAFISTVQSISARSSFCSP